MKKARAYKLEDKIYQDFQKICEILTEQGNGEKYTPAAIQEKNAIDFVQKYKYLLEGRK